MISLDFGLDLTDEVLMQINQLLIRLEEWSLGHLQQLAAQLVVESWRRDGKQKNHQK
jgi:hypothetical protein